MLHLTPYLLRITCYVFMLLVMSYVLPFTLVRAMCYVLNITSYTLCDTPCVPCGYTLRAMWISLYDFPTLVSFEGLFAFVKWFCFLDLKIKNDWQFHFRNSNFSGKGNKGEYL